MGLRVANGPVSWGVDLPDKPGAPPWEEVFSEISEAGYQWCELGPVGYLPNDDERVRAELEARGLGVAGSYIFEPLHDARSSRPHRRGHPHDLSSHRRPRRQLPRRHRHGQRRAWCHCRPQRRSSPPRRSAVRGAVARAAAVSRASPPSTASHRCCIPHAGSYIEFEDEIERVLADTADDGLQLCIDTGHFAYAGVDPVRFLADHRDRTPYLHFKDIDPIVLQKVVSDAVPFFDAISLGVFCPVGQGMVDFNALAAELRNGFDGPGTIEQDRDFRSPTTPLEDAKASLDYLRGLGLTD